MRKLLLASAALALVAGTANAADNDSVTVTTTVPQACNVSITETNVALPADAVGTAVANFTYVCNFTDTTADLAWNSTNGGVTDGFTTHNYSIVSSLGGSGTAAAEPTDSNVATTANVASGPQTVTLQLLSPIIVAGTYTDTLAVTITP